MAKDYVQRMVKEGRELRSKIYALNGFLQSDAGNALPTEKRVLMDKQLTAMRDYSDILDKRLALED